MMTETATADGIATQAASVGGATPEDSTLPPYSVLLGVYHKDNAKHFSAALESLLNQTVPTDDIVLVIDGPVAGDLLRTINKYIAQYPQIHPIWLPKNEGQGHAFNIGLPWCYHEIVLRMDADDISAPNRAEVQLRYLKDNPDVDLVSTAIAEFSETPDNITTIKRVPTEHSEIVKYAKRWNPINQPSAAFKKNAVLDVGGYQHFPRHEDYHLWVRMLQAGKIAANIDEPLLYYRLSDENLDRRRLGPAYRGAIDFHNWKHKIGFANWADTAWMIALMTIIRITPGPIYRFIYRLKRGKRRTDTTPSK